MRKTFEDALNELVEKYKGDGTTALDEIAAALQSELDGINTELETLG